MSNTIPFVRRASTTAARRALRARIGSALIALALICSLLGLSNTSATAAGSIYYVDNTIACSDATSNPGTSASTPLCTLGRAAFLATVPGSTVNVLHGTYAESVLPASGSAGLPITWQAANSSVTVTGAPAPAVFASAFGISNRSYVVIDGFTISNTRTQGIYVDSSNHITISHNHVSYAGANAGAESHQEGIILKTTTNSTLTGNTVDHNSCVGIRLNRTSTGNTISNNSVYSNSSYIAYPVVVVTDAAGIELDDSNNNTVIHNMTYGNEDTGINVYKGGLATGSSNNLVIGNLSFANGDHGIDNNTSANNTIVGNTVQGNVTAGINFEAGSTGSTLANNVLVDNGLNPGPGRKAYNLYVDNTSASGLNANYNLYWINSGAFQINWNGSNYASLAAFHAAVPSQEANGLEGDPLFVAPAAPATGNQQASEVTGDYHINAGSPAIDSANSNATGESSSDIAGNVRADDPATANTGAGSRLYDDRGAYEFQPAATLPVVTTQAVTGISATAAIGNGTVTSLGFPNPSQHGVVWNTAGSPTLTDSFSADGPLSVSGPFTTNMTALVSGTTYHVRAYATNTAGTAYGSEVTFTAGPAPVVTTLPISNVTTTTATGNGNITTLGVPNPTQHGVAWSTSPNPTTANTHTSDGPVSATGTFTSSITGLTPGTVYHVRAYATNTIATSYGADVSFTALKQPTVTTQAVTAITATTATGNGNVTDLGAPNPTDHGVVWALGVNPTIADNKTSDGPVSAAGAFTSNMTGLTPGTLYHVRAYATNAVGTVYGSDVIFTSYVLPVVTTEAVTNIGTTTATGNGTITTLGVPNPTQHGVVWNTSTGPTIANSHTSDGPVSVTGTFTSNMTGLLQGTLYYVRAYVISDAGTVYGTEVIFTTSMNIGTTTPPTNSGNGSNITGLGTVAWSNPGNILADDTSYATVTLSGGQISNYLEGTNYGFAIPSGATVNGIAVTIGRYESGSGSGTDIRDNVVKLIKGGTVTGTNQANNSDWPTGSVVPATYGSSSNLWGATWTPADINAANFGAALAVNSNNLRTASVDYIQIAVTYSVVKAGTTTTVSCGAGTPVATYGSGITCVATVTRAAGVASPSGNVNWTTGGSGNFATSPCVLSGSGASVICSVTYAAASVGTGSHPITATYAGDANFFTSNGNQTVTVNVASVSPVFTAASKPYDGTTGATILTRSLTGIIGADAVTLSGGSATFATKDVGAGKTVNGTGFNLAGAQMANYALSATSATAAADITPKELTVTGITASNKVYDRTAMASINTVSASLAGVVDSEPITLSKGSATGLFADKNIGTGKTVTISGLALGGTGTGNYSLTQPTTTADITVKELTVTGVTASNKLYDATAAATINKNSAVLVGVISGDVVTLNKTLAAGAFADKNVGLGKAVTISGLALNGADIGNYSLTAPMTTADITAAPLTITGVSANDKVYDRLLTATLSGTPALSGVIDGDVVTPGGTASASFANKLVGTNKPVAVLGYTISGTDASNYILAQPSGLAAAITARDLTASATADSKSYDGTTAATAHINTNKLGGDAVTGNYTAATFADKNVGNGKSVSVSGISIGGADAGNYHLLNTTATATADITKAPLTITANNSTKRQGTTRTFAGTEFTTDPATLFDGDSVVSVTLASTGSPAGAIDGDYPIVPSAAVGTGLENYAISYHNGTLAVVTMPNTPPSITEGLSTSVSMSVNGAPTAFSLTLHATDAESDTITWSISTPPATPGSTASVPASNTGNAMSIGFVPVKNYLGTDSFVVTADDGFGGTASITVNVTVNPLRVTFKSAGASDGWVLESGEFTNLGGSVNAAATTFNLGDDSARKQYRGVLSFNTKLPAGAIVTGITLQVKTSTPAAATSMFAAFGNIAVDIKKGTLGALTLAPTDFQAAPTKSAAMTIKNNPLAGGWFFANLGSTANTMINKAGNTQIRLRFTKDDNNNTVANLFKFYSGNAIVANRPMLIIQYYVPLP